MIFYSVAVNFSFQLFLKAYLSDGAWDAQNNTHTLKIMQLLIAAACGSYETQKTGHVLCASEETSACFVQCFEMKAKLDFNKAHIKAGRVHILL